MPRAKNTNIKKANQEVEFTHEQVQELKKCASDPVYFIQNYVKIQHATRGSVPFVLYDYQKEMIISYHTHTYTCVLSSRQSGKSITSAAYLLWYAMFNFDKTVLIAANVNKNAMEMILRIRYAYENLPMWIKPGVKDDGWNKHEISFDNNSRIISTATSEDSGRGMSISKLFLDEFAFVKPSIQESFWTSVSPTLATGGSCIMTSTPNGDMNIYAQIWRGANLGTNGFSPIYIRWDDVPGRGAKFKEEEIGKIGERKWQQEYECAFLSSDALLIDSLYLTNISKEIEAIKPISITNDVKLFSSINQNLTYIVGVDPATGNGMDYSVITIFEFPSMTQVGEYRSNTMSTTALYSVLKNILKYIISRNSSVYYSIENNGVGQGILALYEADETVVDEAEFVSEDGKEKLGFTTTARSKMKSCVILKELLEREKMHIKSNVLLSELKSYVRSKGAYAAQAGATDDCIAATLIVIRIIEEISSYEQAAFDTLYSAKIDEWSNEEWAEDETDDDEYDENVQGGDIIVF